MKRRIHFLSALLLFFIASMNAQYYGEQVLQKSFEQEDFFFKPVYVNPYGLTGYSTAIQGLIDDPLLNLQMNPANLYTDSLHTSFAYLDFHSNREVIDRKDYIYPMFTADARMQSSSMMYRYPFFYAHSRQTAEPLVAAAILGRPFQSSLPQLFVGATYQMIYVDEPYYSIPQDIYKSNVGLDYAGASVADNANIPIVDKYRGVDNMHQSGHFLSFLGGYDLSTDIQVGVSISRVVFDRDGNFGSTNLWDYPYTSNYTSSWYNMESRNQIYRHWDFSAGANFKVEKEAKLGLMGGYLAGKANQGLFHQDTSFYSSNPIGTTNYSAGYRNASTDQQWNDDGKTYYAGLNMRLPVGQARFFNIYYRYSRQDIDLVSASSILDTSKSSYRYQWDTTTSTGNSHYYLSDVRTGKGTKTGTLHRFVVSYQWNPERNMNFDIGISFESQSKETWTNELITSTRNSSNMWTNNATTTNSTYATAESKNLVWSFNTKLTTIQIPIFLNWKTSEKTSVILGLNRKISDWEISDVTLALFNYRDQINDGVTTHKENFGERYTMPTEKTSDIQTTFVLGLVVAPADYFSVRVLATPTVTDDRYIITSTVFQWWIGVQVHP